MIRINLAKRKGAVASASTGAGSDELSTFGELSRRFGLDLGSGGASAADFRELPIRKLALVLFLIAGGEFFLEKHQEEELTSIDASIQQAQADRKRLQGELDQARGFDKIKKAMEGDEQTMRGKIQVIRNLIADRDKPPKLLRVISTVLPADVWLSELKVSVEDVNFKGKGLSLIPVSDFLKHLEESADFTDVKLVSTGQARDESGADMTQFEITARRR